MNNFITAIFFSSLFLCYLYIIEYLTRKKNYKKELTRKLAHISSGMFSIAMAYILKPYTFVIFLLIFFIIICFSYRNTILSSIHAVQRKTYGELFLPLGVLFAYLISHGPTPTYFASMLVLTFSDPLAGLAGNICNKNKKSNIGSVIFFISSLVILFFTLHAINTSLIILAAVIITLVESLSSYGTDNLFIPLTASLLLQFIF